MLMEIVSVCIYPEFLQFTSAKAELREKGQPLCLLRETDFVHQFGVARVGA
jgi:hypothetical protein